MREETAAADRPPVPRPTRLTRWGNATVRRLTGVGVLAMAGTGLVLLSTPGGPGPGAPRLVQLVLVVLAAVIGLAWLRAPTVSQRWIRPFAVWADVGLTATALLVRDRELGLFLATTLAVVGSFLIFYLPRRWLVAHLVWAALTLTAVGVRALLDSPVDPAGVVVRLVVAVLVVVWLPSFLMGHHERLRDTARTQFELARLDPLTGLLNRRGFEGLLGEVLDRGGADGAAVVVVDLDRFKAVNDRYGHARGDAVLTLVADRLRAAVAGAGTPARTGGEEFTVLLEPTGPQECRELAERVRAAVADVADEVPVTASVGVARHGGPLDHGGLRELLDAADRAMYDAKRAGGDRVHDGRRAA